MVRGYTRHSSRSRSGAALAALLLCLGPGSASADRAAVQTHKPKMNVAPRGGIMVLKAKVAIELADELAESPT